MNTLTEKIVICFLIGVFVLYHVGKLVEVIELIVKSFLFLSRSVLVWFGLSIIHSQPTDLRHRNPATVAQRRSNPLLAVGFSIFVAVAVLLPVYATNRSERRKRITAESLVRTELESLSQLNDTDGRFRRQTQWKCDDPWGKSLVAIYSESATEEFIEIRSSGPDSTMNTHDDLCSRRSQPLPKRNAADNILDRGLDFLKRRRKDKQQLPSSE